MIALRQMWHCPICGNVVEVIYIGGGELVCCGQPMQLLQENTVDASLEKHIPVVTDLGDKIEVAIGSIPHPMEEKHYIQWSQLQNSILCRHWFTGAGIWFGAC